MMYIPLPLLPLLPAYWLIRGIWRTHVAPHIAPNPSGIPWVRSQPKDKECDLLAAHILRITNDWREQKGLQRLSENNKLRLAAFNHSHRMAITGEFAHTLSDGLEMCHRIRRCGYIYHCCRENLGVILSPGLTLAELAHKLHIGWVNSPGHFENLIATDVSEIGIAVARDRDGKWYATQNFGSRPFNIRFASVIRPKAPSNLAEPAHHTAPQAAPRANRNTNPPKTFHEYLQRF